MNYSKPLSASEKKIMQSFLKPSTTAKLVNPKEKIGDKSQRTLPIRGQ